MMGKDLIKITKHNQGTPNLLSNFLYKLPSLAFIPPISPTIDPTRIPCRASFTVILDLHQNMMWRVRYKSSITLTPPKSKALWMTFTTHTQRPSLKPHFLRIPSNLRSSIIDSMTNTILGLSLKHQLWRAWTVKWLLKPWQFQLNIFIVFRGFGLPQKPQPPLQSQIKHNHNQMLYKIFLKHNQYLPFLHQCPKTFVSPLHQKQYLARRMPLL